MQPKIYDRFNHPEIVLEKNSGESEVDIALYKPTDKRIEDYIRAGETLEDMRRYQFHSDYLSEMQIAGDTWQDPLLYRGLDRLELERMHKEAIREIVERRRMPDFSSAAKESAEGRIDVPTPATSEPGEKPEASAADSQSQNASQA